MKSLRSRISLLTICLLSVVMIAAAVSGVTAIRDIGNRAADRLLFLLCETGEKNLDFYFESVEQSVEMVSAYVESDLDGLETEKLRAHLERARGIFSKLAYQTDGVVTYYYRIDPAVSDTEKGFWYVNLDGEGFQEHEVTDITLYDTDDTSKLVWFTVPKATGKSIWLPPYITDNLDVRVISYNTPIYYNGTFVGVAGIEIDYSTMAEVVDSITLFDSGYAFINDEEGTIIYHPHIDVKELMVNHPKIPDGLLSDDTIIQYRFEGVEKKAVWLPLENGMRLNVTVPVSEIDALWKDWIAKLAVIFAILLAGAVLLTALFSGRITKPLRDLTAAAKKVDDGALTVPFRPYFRPAAQPNPAPKRASSIVFSNETTQLQGNDNELNSDDKAYDLIITAKRKKIIVESHLREATEVRIVNATGITLDTFTIEPGETIFNGLCDDLFFITFRLLHPGEGEFAAEVGRKNRLIVSENLV